MTVSKLGVVVLVVGINRSLDLVQQSLEENFLVWLKKLPFVKTRVVLHLAEGGIVHNPRTEEWGALESGVSKKQTFDEIEIHSIEEINREVTPVFEKLRSEVADSWHDNHKSVANLLGHFALLSRAASSLGDERVVIVARPDVLWFKNYRPIVWIWMGQFFGFFPRWGRFGGLNDRFAILPARLAEKFLGQSDSIVSYASKKRSLHAEKFLAWLFRGQGVFSVLRVPIVRVRLGGRVEIRDFGQFYEFVSSPFLRRVLISIKDLLRAKNK